MSLESWISGAAESQREPEREKETAAKTETETETAKETEAEKETEKAASSEAHTVGVARGVLVADKGEAGKKLALLGADDLNQLRNVTRHTEREREKEREKLFFFPFFGWRNCAIFRRFGLTACGRAVGG